MGVGDHKPHASQTALLEGGGIEVDVAVPVSCRGRLRNACSCSSMSWEMRLT
jgi:hypothetical protein